MKVAALIATLMCAGIAVPPSAADPRVVLDPAARGDRALAFAAAELARYAPAAVEYAAAARAGDIAIGRDAPAVRAADADAAAPPAPRLRPEGFAIRTAGGVVEVLGADRRGDVYGALWLAERIRLDPAFLAHPACVREPAVPYREFTDGHEYLRPGRGYEGWLQECLRLGINTIQFSGASPEESRLGKAYGLWYMGGTAPFSNLPLDSIIARYGAEVSEYPGQLCPLKPRVWDEQRDHVRQMLRSYPEIDFVRTSMGDLPEDYHVYDCHGPECAKVGRPEGLLRACRATAEVVVGEFGKTFFISSWGNPPERYPLNVPAQYEAIMAGLPRTGIVSTINNCEHDFYLNSPPNPLIGRTDRPQDLYFEVTAEYAGAGFLPVYTGPQIRERFGMAVRSGHAAGITGRLWEGVGLWTRDVLWTRANLYAIYRAAWEPYGNPRDWARDWAALTFGPGGSDDLADALMLSEELARRTFWVPGFSGEKGPAYAITRRNVITDGTHYIRWARHPHLAAYRRCGLPAKFREAIETTNGTTRLRDRMLERWNAARPAMRDAAMAAACDRDFRHFSAVVNVLIPYQRALLHWCRTQDPGISVIERCRSARAAVRHARATRAAWRQYRAAYDLCRDAGMTEMLAVYVRDCAAISAPIPVVAAAPGGKAQAVVRVLNNAWPAGLAATVRLVLPPGWTGDPDRKVTARFGDRRALALWIKPPAGAREGDYRIPVKLVAAGSARADQAEVRVKVLNLRTTKAPGAPHTAPRNPHTAPNAASPGPRPDTRTRHAGAGNPRNAPNAASPGPRPGTRTEADTPATGCPRAAAAPVIDGVLEPGEWPADRGGRAPSPVRLAASGKDNLYTVAARTAWDARCLYVAFDVADDMQTPLGIRDTLYRSDREHIVLDLDGDRRDDYEVAFVRAADALVAWPITVGGVFTSTQVAYREKVAPSGRGIRVACAARRGGPGRVIEAAIPWAWLGGFRPAVGKVVGVSVQGGDVDGARGLRTAIQWPSRAQVPDGPYLTWGRVDKPTPFADLVFLP